MRRARPGRAVAVSSRFFVVAATCGWLLMPTALVRAQDNKEQPPESEPVRKPPGGLLNGRLDLGGRSEAVSQSVGQGKTTLDVDVLPGAYEVQIGKRITFDVVVVNDGKTRATNVNVQVTVEVQTPDGTSVAGGVRYEAARLVGAPGPPKDCAVVADGSRRCQIGVLLPDERRKVAVQLAVPREVRASQLVVSAKASIDATMAGEDRRTIRLVRDPRADKNVDLRVTVEPAVTVAGPGAGVLHVVRVRNMSEREEATGVQVQIEQRLVVRDRGQFTVLNDGLRGGLSELPARCTATEHRYQCELGTLGPRREARLVLESTMVRDLPVNRWGQIRTKARARSRESDPSPEDNLARGHTSVVSRLPELVIFGRVIDPGGRARIVPVQSVALGQEFAVAARFMDPSVEVHGSEIRAELVVEGSAPTPLVLRDNRYTSYAAPRMYRSEQVRLVPPAEPAAGDTGGLRMVRAPRGTPLRAVYVPSEAASPRYPLERLEPSWATVLVTGGREP